MFLYYQLLSHFVRGKNPPQVERCQALLRRKEFFPYVIEVVEAPPHEKTYGADLIIYTSTHRTPQKLQVMPYQFFVNQLKKHTMPDVIPVVIRASMSDEEVLAALRRFFS